MAKIEFDIKYRPQIESGEYKVETRDGRPVNIVSFEMTDTNNCPIAAQFRLCAGTPVVYLFDKDGRYKGEGISDYDLFIITPDKELSEFEIRLLDWLSSDTCGEIPMERMKEVVRNRASELLSLAREQFIKDGYVIEKKAFHDAVENISDKHLAEMSVEYSTHCKIENGTRHAIMNCDTFKKVAQKFINIGKADTIKDLPKWRTWRNGAGGNGDGIPKVLVYRYGEFYFASCLGISGEKYIMLDELKKLPGFKED